MEDQNEDIIHKPCKICGELFRNHLDLVKHSYTHITETRDSVDINQQYGHNIKVENPRVVQDGGYLSLSHHAMSSLQNSGGSLSSQRQNSLTVQQTSRPNISSDYDNISNIRPVSQILPGAPRILENRTNNSDPAAPITNWSEVKQEETDSDQDLEDDKMRCEPKDIEFDSDEHDGSVAAYGDGAMETGSDDDSGLKVKFNYNPLMSKRYQKNAKVYKCEICPKTYTLKSSVTRHMKVHDGDFICSVCGDNFMDSRSLLKHKKTHDEKILLCRTCGKSFKDKHSLARHVAICSVVVQGSSKGNFAAEKIEPEENRETGKEKDEPEDELSDEDGSPSEEEIDNNDPDFEIPDIVGIKKKPPKMVPDKIIRDPKKEEETPPKLVKPVRPKAYLCEKCDKAFTLRSSLKRHMKKHTLNGQCFQCSDCEKTFSLKTSLQRHFLNKHAPKPPPEPSLPLIPDEGEPFYDKSLSNPKLDFCLIPTTPKKEKPFKCFICGNTFGHSSSLQRHLKTHAELGEGSEEKVIQCEICSETFNQFFNLQKHIMEHTGEKPFKCEFCGKSFFENGHLRQHIRTHTGERPYQCHVCSKAFSQGSSLRIHMKLHTTTVSEREYTCVVCSKNFSSYGNMQRHLVKHSGLRPHKCDLCDKTFMEKSHMEKHRVLHTGEKNFVCQFCSKSFSQGGNLRQHIKIHTGDKPHICSYCSKAFAEKSKLKEHFKIHTGERNYKCEVCQKAFGQKSGLKRHMRQHTGERPYECSECDKIYAHANSLSKHRLRHHTHIEVLIE